MSDDDVRQEFLLSYLGRSQGITLGDWQCMLVHEDCKTALFDFYDNDEIMLLTVIKNDKGEVKVTNSFPPHPKNKFSFFLKKENTVFTRDEATMKENTYYGDLSSKGLSNLIVFIEQVTAPLITSDVNQEKWPETVVADVKYHTNEICGALYTTQGQLRGKTLLPMPLNVDVVEENDRIVNEQGPTEVDLQVKTTIEALVVKWGQQIDEVLKQDSSRALQNGFPTPFAEMAFWEDRVHDLQCIYDQLNDEMVQMMADILEQTESTYWPSFRQLFRNVVGAVAEAQDILAHLKPLRKHLEVVRSAEFDELDQHIRPLMHCVCLVWGHSKYYCSSARIIVLLQEICNMLIEMAREYIGGNSVFKLPPEEALIKTTTAYRNLKLFRELYATHKNQLPVYFDAESEVKHWDFLPHLVFRRFDFFLQRLRQIHEYFTTTVEFGSLDNMVFGGDKGRYLTSKMADLSKDFKKFLESYKSKKYDCTDPEDESFDNDYRMLVDKISEMDKRLAALISEAMDDCYSPEAYYKTINMLDSLIKRPMIRNDMIPKYHNYCKMIDEDLGSVKKSLDDDVINAPPLLRTNLDSSLPPFSAAIAWAEDMKGRVTQEYEEFHSLELPISSENYVTIMNEKYSELKAILHNFQSETYNLWSNIMTNEAYNYLKEPVFIRNEEGEVIVNFNYQLTCALKEVKYMEQAGHDDIPQSAKSLYQQRDVFKRNLMDLDIIASCYNKVKSSANKVELKLLDKPLQKINSQIDQGMRNIKWSSENITEFIETLKDPIQTLESNLLKSQENIRIMKKKLEVFMNRPFYERKGGNPEELLDLSEAAKHQREERFRAIVVTSSQIQELMRENNKLLVHGSSSHGTAMEDYEEYVDDMIVESLIKLATISVGYLADHTDPNLTPGPLFEIRMDLSENEMLFEPPLDFSQSNSFANVMEDILIDIVTTIGMVERVKQDGPDNYNNEIDTSDTIADMRQDIEDRVQNAMTQAYDFGNKFEMYSYLWEEDRAECLQQFIKYGRILSSQELEAKLSGEEPEPQEVTTKEFRQIISKYEELYTEVEKIQAELVIDKWFRLNLRPFRQALMNSCKKWSLTFKQYLIDTVTTGLNELENFINMSEKIFALPPSDNESIGKIKNCINEVNERASTNFFDQMNDYILVLTHFEYEFSKVVLQKMEELPTKWSNLKKLAVLAKQKAP